MRKMLSAGVLALAAAAAVLPGTAALASADEEAEWTFVRSYHERGRCLADGAKGVVGESWVHYRCHLDFERGLWLLEIQKEEPGTEPEEPPADPEG